MAGKPQGGGRPLARAGPPVLGEKGAPAERVGICANCTEAPGPSGQGVRLLIRRSQARVPPGVLFMRRNRARLARCFWGIGPLRSLSACRQKRGGTISNAVLFVRAPPVLRARARLRSAGCALARANKSLKVPGSIPGPGIGSVALPLAWLRLAGRSAVCNTQASQEWEGARRPGAAAFRRGGVPA